MMRCGQKRRAASGPPTPTRKAREQEAKTAGYFHPTWLGELLGANGSKDGLQLRCNGQPDAAAYSSTETGPPAHFYA
jgi:hypothetical protein